MRKRRMGARSSNGLVVIGVRLALVKNLALEGEVRGGGPKWPHSWAVLGRTINGSYAEYTCPPTTNVITHQN